MMDDGLAPPQPATTRTATRTAAASANDSIYAAVLRLKRAAVEAEEVVHGWTVSVKPREGTTQTDIKLVSPDGGKFFSLVSIRKKLGIADARAREPQDAEVDVSVDGVEPEPEPELAP